MIRRKFGMKFWGVIFALLCQLTCSKVMASEVVVTAKSAFLLENEIEQGVSLFPDAQIIGSVSGPYSVLINTGVTDDIIYWTGNSDFSVTSDNTIEYQGNTIGTVLGYKSNTDDLFQLDFYLDAAFELVEQSIRQLEIKNENATAGNREVSLLIQYVSGASALVNRSSFDINEYSGLPKIAQASSIFIEDINGDSKLELVIGESSGSISVFDLNTLISTNQLVGSEVTGNLLEVAVQGEAKPTFVDYDDDGDLDLFVGSDSGKVHYFKNVGNVANPFYEEQINSANPLAGRTFSGAASLEFFDIDFDGDLDLLISDSSGELHYYRYQESDTVSDLRPLLGTLNPFYGYEFEQIRNVKIADVNNDGINDLVGIDSSQQLLAYAGIVSKNQLYFTDVIELHDYVPFAHSSSTTLTFYDHTNGGLMSYFSISPNGTFSIYENTSDFLVTISEVNDKPNIFSSTEYSVYENDRFVAELVANDEEDGNLQLVLSGDDASLFSIDEQNRVQFRNPPNFEQPTDLNTDGVYQLTLSATDSLEVTTERNIMVTVSDVNEAPEIVFSSQYTVTENQSSVATGSIINPEEYETFVVDITGDDANTFILVEGELKFVEAPDYEFPADADLNNVYSISLIATDLVGNQSLQSISIQVSNEIEAVGIYNLGDVELLESSATNGNASQLFAEIRLTDLGDEWTDQTLTVSGLESGDSLNFSEHESYIFVENSIVYDGNLVAQIEDNNGVTTITFTQFATGSVVNDIINLLSFSTQSTQQNQIRYISISLEHPVQGAIRFINNVSYSAQEWLDLDKIDVGDNASPALVQLYESQDAQLVVGELFNEMNLYLATSVDENIKFTPNQIFTNPFANINVPYGSKITFADYDEDGDQDLFVGESSGKITVFDNVGSANEPNFALSTELSFDVLDVGRFAAPQVLDVDKNGNLDLIIGNDAGGLYLFDNFLSVDPSSLTTDDADNLLAEYELIGNIVPFMADINRDGFNDILLGRVDGSITYLQYDDELTKYIDTGEQNPFAGIVVNGHASPYLFDVDIDGDDDLIIGASDGTIAFFQNNAGVLVSIIDENAAPTIVSESIIYVGDLQSFVTQIQTTDFENDAISLSLGGPDAGLFDVSLDGVLSFISKPLFAQPLDENGDNIYQIQINAEDTAGSQSTIDVHVVVQKEQFVDIEQVTDWYQDENREYVFTIQNSGEFVVNGEDSDLFELNGNELHFIEGANYESPRDDNRDNTYQLVLTTLGAEYPINVVVQNVNEAPVIQAVTEYQTEENVIYTVPLMIADPDSDEVSVLVSGDDAEWFVWENQALKFIQPMNFERPLDVNSDSIYEITITVEDPYSLSVSHELTMQVTNQNELVNLRNLEFNVAENDTNIGRVISDEFDLGQYEFELSGSDQQWIRIDGFGELSFESPPDFELPNDANQDNQYDVSIAITSAVGETASFEVSVTISDEFESPSMELAESYSVMEGEIFVTQINIANALASSQLSLSGVDSNSFSIVDGNLNFVSAPDFEFPKDANSDGIYTITLQISGSNTIYKTNVVVTDSDDPATVTGGDSASFYSSAISNGSTGRLFSNVSVNDPEDSFANNTLTISGLAETESLSLSFNPTYSVDTEASTGAIVFDGQVIGYLNENDSGEENNFSMEFNEFADNEAVTAVLNSIEYSTERGASYSDVYQVVLTNSLGQSTSILGHDHYSSGILIPVADENNELMNPTVVDLNSDGVAEVVFGTKQGALVAFEQINGEAIVSTSDEFNTVYPGLYSAPKFADFDNDGDMDLVVGNSDGFVMYYENQGTSTEPEFVWVDANNPFSGIDAGTRAVPNVVDFDNDGDLDVVIINNAGQLKLVQNIGSAHLPHFEILSQSTDLIETLIPGFELNLAFRDIDHDGDIDVYVGNEYGEIFGFNNTSASSVMSFAHDVNLNYFSGMAFEQGAYPMVFDHGSDRDEDLWVYTGNGALYFYENTAGYLVNVQSDEQSAGISVKLSSAVESEGGKQVTITPEVENESNATLTYLWEQLSGTSVELTGKTDKTLSFVAPLLDTQETLSFQLTVSSTTGFVKKSVDVIVMPNNVIIDISVPAKLTVNEGADTQIEATIEHNSEDALTVVWTQVSGPSVEITNANNASMNFVAPTVDTDTALEFKIEVTIGDTSVHEQVIVVVKSIQDNTSNETYSPSEETETASKTEAAVIPAWILMLLSMLVLMRVRKS